MTNLFFWLFWYSMMFDDDDEYIEWKLKWFGGKIWFWLTDVRIPSLLLLRWFSSVQYDFFQRMECHGGYAFFDENDKKWRESNIYNRWWVDRSGPREFGHHHHWMNESCTDRKQIQKARLFSLVELWPGSLSHIGINHDSIKKKMKICFFSCFLRLLRI